MKRCKRLFFCTQYIFLSGCCDRLFCERCNQRFFTPEYKYTLRIQNLRSGRKRSDRFSGTDDDQMGSADNSVGCQTVNAFQLLHIFGLSHIQTGCVILRQAPQCFLIFDDNAFIGLFRLIAVCWSCDRWTANLKDQYNRRYNIGRHYT